MKKILILLSLIFLTVNLRAQQKIEWNGYSQFRFTDNYQTQQAFSLRRVKFWVNGSSAFYNGNLSYKVQANFLQQVKYQLLLQDVLIKYKAGNLEVTAGQFVPDFSLQRKQPDYSIPFNERSDAVNALVPGAETMGRDIGAEIKLNADRKGAFSFGFFNGSGANNPAGQNNFLFVNRGSVYLLNNGSASLQMGYNISYRNAHNLQFSKIFAPGYFFNGNDFRFGFDELFSLGSFELQAEYLEAHLGNKTANGFTALADLLIADKHLLAISVEQYNDLNLGTEDAPWYAFGYSYLLKGNEIKFTVNNKFQFTSNKTNSLTTIQIQYFFN